MSTKRIKFHLQLWDGLWSIPLAMSLFLGVGIVLQTIFYNRDDPQGAPGFYDPSFLQSAFYASAIQVFINFMVWLGIHFNFRGIKRYHKGHHVWNEQGPVGRVGQPLTRREQRLHVEGDIPKEQVSIKNESKNDFQSLQPWQRLALLFALYVFFSLQWWLIWAHLQ